MKYKFRDKDVFRSRIKTYPHVHFFIYDGNKYFGRQTQTDSTPAGKGSLDLYELNSGRTSNLIHPFVIKGSDRLYLRSIDSASFNADYNYGDQILGSYPLSASIAREHNSTTSLRLRSLLNPIRQYRPISPVFNDTFTGRELSLISVPSIFYGSSLRKGAVSLKFFISGSLVGHLHDKYKNGELIEVTGSSVGSVGGVVLYDHGVLILTGAWDLDSSHTEDYEGLGAANPTWINWGTTASIHSSSFTLDFDGVNYVDVITMLAHAEKGYLNYSNNPTYLLKNQTSSFWSPVTSSISYRENARVECANILSSSYQNVSSSFERETFISRVQIYDDDGDVIAVAKTATPIRKKSREALTFKLKIDI